MMQPDSMAAAADSSWTTAAADVVRDVAAALQQGGDSDDIKPCSDACSLEALCSRVTQACLQAAAATYDTSSLTAKALHALHQLSSSLMSLTAAVCCEPAAAQPLLAAGSHKEAVNQLKDGVKALALHLVKCLDVLDRAPGPQATQPGWPGPASRLLEGLLPAVRAMVLPLLHIALASAASIFGPAPGGNPDSTPAAIAGDADSSNGPASPAIPKEMCSMVVLNMSWVNLTALLVALPAKARLQVLQQQDVLRGLQCALQQLQGAVCDLPEQPRDKQTVLVRFWLQSVSRLSSIAGDLAAMPALQLLVQATVMVYACTEGEQYNAVMDLIEQIQLKQRMLACVAAVLIHHVHDSELLQHKLDCLLTTPTTPASSSICSKPALRTSQQEQEPQQQQHHTGQQVVNEDQLLQAHLLVVLDIMQQLPSMPVEAVQLGSGQLLQWVAHTAGCRLAEMVLASAIGGNVLLHILHTLLYCFVGCACAAPQHQPELLSVVTQIALSEHPLVALIAQQLMADVMARSTPGLLHEQLALLQQLLGASAACAALPAAPSELQLAPERLLETMCAVLQACNPEAAAAWAGSSLLPGDLLSSCGSSSGSWVDAARCSLLVCHCELLQRLHGQLVLPGLCPALLDDWLNQLWLTAQQVMELLGPQHQPQQAAAPCAAADQQLLVQHQLVWLLQGMQAVMKLHAALSASQAGPNGGASTLGPSPLVQGCASLALDLLKVLRATPAASPAPAASASPPEEVHTACIAAVLEVLAAAGQLVLTSDDAEWLLGVLMDVACQHECLHTLLPGVCGSMAAAWAGNEKQQELFQMLFSSSRWPVQHATFEGLLRLLRHQGSSGSAVVGLLPPHMRSSGSSGEASPAAVAALRAHLMRTPDSLAQQAYTESYQRLAAQHCAALLACVNSSPSGGAAASSSLAALLAALLGDLDSRVASCSRAATAVGAGQQGPGPAPRLGGPAQELLQLAAAASSSLQGADKALVAAERDVGALQAVARAAAAGRQLGCEEVQQVSQAAALLRAECAHMCSRLRELQSQLDCLKS